MIVGILTFLLQSSPIRAEGQVSKILKSNFGKISKVIKKRYFSNSQSGVSSYVKPLNITKIKLHLTQDQSKFSLAPLLFASLFLTNNEKKSSNCITQNEKEIGRINQLAQNSGAEFLIHRTPCENLSEILKSTKLLPGNQIGRKNFDYKNENKAQNYVYLSISNQVTEKGPWFPETKKYCALIFSLSVLDDFINDYHYANGWLYGNKYENFYAESTETKKLKGMFEYASDTKTHIWGQNEVVLYKPLPLKYLLRVEYPEKIKN